MVRGLMSNPSIRKNVHPLIRVITTQDPHPPEGLVPTNCEFQTYVKISNDTCMTSSSHRLGRS